MFMNGDKSLKASGMMIANWEDVGPKIQQPYFHSLFYLITIPSGKPTSQLSAIVAEVLQH